MVPFSGLAGGGVFAGTTQVRFIVNFTLGEGGEKQGDGPVRGSALTIT